MKAQTCCCLVFKTSLNQYKREYMPCTVCNKIVCKNCFGTKFKESTWEQAVSERSTWLCPSCSGNCPCNRCRKKPTTKLQLQLSPGPISTEDFKHSSNGHSQINGYQFHNLSSPPSPTSSQINASCNFNGNGIGIVSIGIPASMDKDRYSNFVEKEKYTLNLCSNLYSNHHMDKSRPKIDKVHLHQLQEYVEREKRCETNVKEMERLLSIMKKEREEVTEARIKLEESMRASVNELEVMESIPSPVNSKSPIDSVEFEVSASASFSPPSASNSPPASTPPFHILHQPEIQVVLGL